MLMVMYVPITAVSISLPKTHVARRRLCMSATTDFWINDAKCEPLFFVTAEANDSLLSMLEKEVIPQVNKICRERQQGNTGF